MEAFKKEGMVKRETIEQEGVTGIIYKYKGVVAPVCINCIGDSKQPSKVTIGSEASLEITESKDEVCSVCKERFHDTGYITVTFTKKE